MNKSPQVGVENTMKKKPKYNAQWYKGSSKLEGKIAIITGGDSGIGRSVALLFAREGARVAIVYLDEHSDAKKTQKLVEKEGQKAVLISGDLKDPAFSKEVVTKTRKHFGQIDILVNNAAIQYHEHDIGDLKTDDIKKTFETNIFSMLYLTREAISYMKQDSSIINTTSVTAFRGSKHLVDYSATKGAIMAFTRSLSAQLAPKNIRVNAVAPGPVWTPLITASFPKRETKNFGTDVPLGRPAQPEDIAPAYVFLASRDANYVTGQVIHVNGGEIVD